jgi:cyanobactin maturation PatA/PatG family protease
MSAPAVQASDNAVPGFARAPEKQDAPAGISKSPVFSDVSAIPGVRELWAETRGDPAVCVAILDGPVDLAHPSLRGANLAQLESLVSGEPDTGPATQHGTHVASIIFGRHDSPVPGLAPFCRGISIPIFASIDADTFQVCSQIDLARALSLAVQHGAHVINISGGELSLTGSAYPLLENAVRECARAGVLIVAAAGNQGCECLHIPAALDSVLAVGGMDSQGLPLDFSNWGGAYRARGLLAPAVDIPGALPGGGTTRRTGTSYAAPIVTGIAALLLSLERRRGQRIDSARVREALLASASGCAAQPVPDCRRLLAGRLNVRGAVSIITGSTVTMEQPALPQTAGIAPDQIDPALSQAPVVEAVRSPNRLAVTHTAPEPPAVPTPRSEEAPGPAPAKSCGCGCKGAATSPQLVYALGQLDYDLMTEARCDSLVQRIAGLNGDVPQRGLAFDHAQMLAYLEKNPWDAAAIEWTLTLDGNPTYAIRPHGPFAANAYERLRESLAEQERQEIERVSIPGILVGKARLLNGQVVPVLVPDLRGMYSWTTSAMVKALVGDSPAKGAAADGRAEYERKKEGIQNFLQRIYHEARNLGMMPQERALNFAATNAFEIGEIYASAVRDRMELDTIRATRSPICRPESDCWDIELYFFYPDRQVQTVRKVYRFTVDVSDTVPVTVGPMRTWSSR